MTPNKEDYLKCIYEIGIEVPKITNKEIAARMQVSPPAVTEMIKRMQSENLILKNKENGYILTDIGLKLVSELYRKHRLIEVFLVHHLDYTSNQIHDEAEVLEKPSNCLTWSCSPIWMACFSKYWRSSKLS